MWDSISNAVVIDVIDETGCFIRNKGEHTGACKRYTHEEIRELVKSGISLFSNRGGVNIGNESGEYLIDGEKNVAPCVDLTKGKNKGNPNKVIILTLNQVNEILGK